MRSPSLPRGAAFVSALFLAAAAALFGRAEARGDATALPPLPGPAPRPHSAPADPAKANEACASCHAEIAAEWQSSLHKQAWTDPVFQQAYAIESVAFCRGCHAPEADPEHEPGAGAKAVGVGCTSCHVEGAHIVGAKALSTNAPHPVFADARLATAQACAACHQFNFPGKKLPMQNTVAEHARSSLSGTSCQSCHMPLSPSQSGKKPHRNHAFAVISNPAMIRRAAKVSAARVGGRAIEVSVSASGAGHAFPTGDMFRRLEVRAEVIDAKGKVVQKADPVFFGRVFADLPRDAKGSLAFHRTQTADTRLPPPGAGGPRVARLQFPRSIARAKVRWKVLYERMETAMAASFGVDPAVDEIVVGEGVLLPLGEEAKQGDEG